MSEDNIKVTVKVRPLIKREKERQLPKVWKVNGCTIQHVDAVGTQNERFTFGRTPSICLWFCVE